MSPNITGNTNGNTQNAIQYGEQERQHITHQVIDRINQDKAAEIECIKKNHEAEVQGINQINETKKERMKQKIECIKKNHEAEVQGINQINETKIERMKQELELVKNERDYYKDMVLKHFIINKD
jgi:hypothetical protein